MGTSARHARDIVAFDFGFDANWHEVPRGDNAADAWAAQLVASLLPEALADDPAAGSLRYQLAQLQRNLAAMPIDGLTGVVWIPDPASGYAGAMAGFALSELASDETPDAVVAAAEASRATSFGTSAYLEVEPWRGHIDGVGPYVGVRELLSHTDQETPDESSLEERVVCTVFPDGAAQAVLIFLSAESIGSFWNIAEQAAALVGTLRVRLAEVAS